MKKEAKIFQKINPRSNLLRLSGTGKDPAGGIVLVLEFYESSLESLAQNQKLETDEALRLSAQVFRGQHM